METTIEDAAVIGPSIRLSGHVALSGDSDSALGGVRQRRLLAGLTLRRGSVVSLEWLNDVVWYGEEPPDAAPGTIRTYVYRLRKALADADGRVLIDTVGKSYRFVCPADAVDLVVFEADVADAESALEAGDPGRALVACEQAMALWRGEPMGEFGGEAWAVADARRYDELHLCVEERYASALLGLGRLDDAIAELEGLSVVEPLRERRFELLMRALVRAGRQGDALHECAVYRRRLRDESGLTPSTTISELEARILADDETLLRPPTLRTIRSFELLEQLSSDVERTTWRARHPSLDQEVQLDSFASNIADDPRFVSNFEARLRKISRLEHPAIVTPDDYWREPGSAQVVARLLRGRSLRDRLRDVDAGELRFDELADHLGEALHAVHLDGAIHGGVSLDTIVSDEHSHWYLTGFANVSSILGEATEGADVRAFTQVLAGIAEVLVDDRSDAMPLPAENTMAALLTEIQHRSRPALRAPRVTDDARITRNPYPGLRPFDDSDRRTFFGRTALIDDVIDGLDDQLRFTVVVGPSGTGKSSLLQAGLLPVLAERGALVVRLTPGLDPLGRLAAAIRSVSVGVHTQDLDGDVLVDDGLSTIVAKAIPTGQPLVVAVDQCEELFFGGIDERTGRQFLELLLDAASSPGGQIRVVVALRSDHFGGLLATTALAEATSNAMVPVPPLSPAQIEEVIVGPAHLAGVDVEAHLVSAMTAELVDRPSLLPHLQHLLRQMFEQRQGNILTARVCEELGGVTGSLGRSGELLYERLNAGERVALRRILRRLSHIDAEDKVTRRQALVDELVRGDEVARTVLRSLGDERLVVFDHEGESRAPIAELTHESLFRAWPRLAGWLREDGEITRLLEDLSERSRSWILLGRDPGELLRGMRLDQAVELLPTVVDDLSEREHDFVAASQAARDQEIRREQRRRQRLRTSLVVAMVAFLISAVAGVVAFRERNDAETAAANAEQSAEVARSAEDAALRQAELAEVASRVAVEQTAIADERRMLGAVGQLRDSDPRLGLLLASQLYTDAPNFETLSLLQEALVGLPRGFERYFGADVAYTDVALSVDGTRLAGLSGSGIQLWDVETGEELLAIETQEGVQLALSPTYLYVLDGDGAVVELRLETLDQRPLEVPLTPTAIATQGDVLVVGSGDGDVAFKVLGGLWQQLPQSLRFPVNRLHIGRNERYVVASSDTNGAAAAIWNLEEASFVGTHGHLGPHGLAHTRDAIIVGDALASIGPDSSLQIKNLPDLTTRSSIRFVGSSLGVGANDSFVVTDDSGSISIRDAGSGIELDRLRRTGTLQGGTVSISGDGALAAQVSSRGIELWSLDGGRALPESFVLDGELSEYVISDRRNADGLSIAQRFVQTNPGLVVLDNGEPTELWNQVGLPRAMSAQFNGDTLMVLSAPDLSLRFVDIDGTTLTLLPDVGLSGLSANDIWAFARLGNTIALATGRTEKQIAILERTEDSIELLQTIDHSLNGHIAIGFFGDGRWLIAGSDRGEVAVWATDDWEIVAQADDVANARLVGKAKVDERTVLSLSIDGTAYHIDVSSLTVTQSTKLSGSGFSPLLFVEILDSGHVLTVPPPEAGGAARLWDLDEAGQVGMSFPAVGEGGSIFWDDELHTNEGRVVHVWPMDVDTWAGHACRIAGRSLTAEEWAEHGPTGVPFDPVC